MNEELETEMPKRGPGRPPKVQTEETPMASRDYDEITYIPDTGDLVSTTIDFDPSRPNSGIRFSANLPVKVKKTRTIDQLETREKHNADGQRVTYAVTVKGRWSMFCVTILDFRSMASRQLNSTKARLFVMTRTGIEAMPASGLLCPEILRT